MARGWAAARRLWWLSRTEAAAGRRLPSNHRGRIRTNSRMGALRPQTQHIQTAAPAEESRPRLSRAKVIRPDGAKRARGLSPASRGNRGRAREPKWFATTEKDANGSTWTHLKNGEFGATSSWRRKSFSVNVQRRITSVNTTHALAAEPENSRYLSAVQRCESRLSSFARQIHSASSTATLS